MYACVCKQHLHSSFISNRLGLFYVRQQKQADSVGKLGHVNMVSVGQGKAEVKREDPHV